MNPTERLWESSFRGVILLAAGLATACSSDPSDHMGPREDPTPPTGRVATAVVVSGDPSLGPTFYIVSLNDQQFLSLAANDSSAFVSLPPGWYTVRLSWQPVFALFSGARPQWCVPTAPIERLVEVIRGDNRAEATFSVDCPPLEGTGHLLLSVGARGAHLPDSVKVTLNRTIGPRVQLAVAVASNDSTTMEIPVGVFQAFLKVPSNCKTTESFLGPHNPRWAVFRRNRSSRVAFQVTCT